MKKIGIVLSLLLFAGLLMTWVVTPIKTKKEASQKSSENNRIIQSRLEINTVEKDSDEQARERVTQLIALDQECKNRYIDFSDKVRSNHNIIIDAIESELQAGKSIWKLFRYADQYQTYYKSYDDLVFLAYANIIQERYKFASSAKILTQWQGLNILEGLKTEHLAEFAEQVDSMPKGGGYSIQMELSQQNLAANLSALLSNQDSFNTYLRSPLSVAGQKYISPSFLFVLGAKTLPFDEFKSMISGHKFTVNDIALAIKTDMPTSHIIELIKTADDLDVTPILVRDDYEFLHNLADFAVNKYDVELLKVLAEAGVHPTNQPGLLTGMDIAVSGLSELRHDDKELFQQSSKYYQTVKYLHDMEYGAHASFVEDEDGSRIWFSSRYAGFYDIDARDNNVMSQLLTKVTRLEKERKNQQKTSDDSPISLAIQQAEKNKAIEEQRSQQCKNNSLNLLAAQQLLSREKLDKLIHEVQQQGGDTEANLHSLDPALVNVWKRSDGFQKQYSTRNLSSGSVDQLIEENNYQQLLAHSSTTPLSRSETDSLFLRAWQEPEIYVDIWEARTSPIPPQNLFSFSRLSIERWKKLRQAGFDFTVKDRAENTLLDMATMNSKEVFDFLIGIGHRPDFHKLGMDVLDVALEDAFNKDKVNTSISSILPFVKKLEPNHRSRIARLKRFKPKLYDELIKLDERLVIQEGVKVNQYHNYWLEIL
ncbi:hypothetical protein [Parashewanella tropica]|uniref:hypothetical protein n=1 Tax=Parashewanella tropica TaxID=2547970 RepID=UPI00105A4C3F|nr:hypothetical protein [Parashewanella tropica]